MMLSSAAWCSMRDQAGAARVSPNSQSNVRSPIV